MNLFKSKTVWTGIGGLVTAGAGYATGDMAGAAAIQLGITSLLGVFLKLAIDKTAP
jgi:hypothetical protein